MITDYKTLEKIKFLALEEAEKAKKNASNSTVNFVVDVSGSTCYFNNYSDIHLPDCDMNQLRKDLAADAQIPNMYVGFGGDETNMALVGSVSSTYESVTNPEDELEMHVDVIEESGIVPHIVYFEDGNHGLRLTKMTSIRPGKYITNKLGIPEKHAENIARVVFMLDNPIKEGQKVGIVLSVRHGENTSANPGAKVDQTLSGIIIKAVDIAADGHTHKIVFGSTKINLRDPNRKMPKEKTVYTVNFGSRQENSHYPDQAGYPLTGKVNGEVLRIALIPNEAKNDFTVAIDFINRRDILNQHVTSVIKKVDYELNKINLIGANTKQELERMYKKTVSKLLQNTLKNYNEKKDAKLELTKEDYPNKLFLSLLSGFVVGDPTVKNEKDVDATIATLAKLDNSCKVVLNGDMVYYKKADFWKKEKYPSHTFSYMELLAEKIAPIKDKIIAYNSGLQEQKIMNWQGEDLAKMAMTRLQMDEKLVYMPYNKTQLLAEQKRIQSEQVELYNKTILEKEKKKVTNSPKLVDSLKKYRVNPASDLMTEAEVESCLVKKLREEHKLLSLRADREIIDSKFPLDSIELRTPHTNLVQHMVCQLAGIDPKKISINSEPDHDSYNSIKIKSPENKIVPINLIGSYSKSVASRGAQQSNLSKKENQNPGCNIYYTNSRSGKEYFTKGLSLVEDSNGTGQNSLVDTFYISAGRFDGSQNRVDQELSSNRLYILDWAELEQNKDEQGRGIYKAANRGNALIGRSVGYESALYEDESILKNIIVKQVMDSFNDNFEKLMHKEFATKKEQAKQLILNSLEKIKPEAKVTEKADKPEPEVKEETK